MTEKEIKSFANKLRTKLVFFMLAFYVMFYLAWERVHTVDETFMLVFFVSIYTLGCAAYFVEKLVIAVMAKKEE